MVKKTKETKKTNTIPSHNEVVSEREGFSAQKKPESKPRKVAKKALKAWGVVAVVGVGLIMTGLMMTWFGMPILLAGCISGLCISVALAGWKAGLGTKLWDSMKSLAKSAVSKVKGTSRSKDKGEAMSLDEEVPDVGSSKQITDNFAETGHHAGQAQSSQPIPAIPQEGETGLPSEEIDRISTVSTDTYHTCRTSMSVESDASSYSSALAQVEDAPNRGASKAAWTDRVSQGGDAAVSLERK